MSTTVPISTAAVIGCGRKLPGKVGWAQGHIHANAYVQAFPGLALYGVDPDPDNLRAFGEAFTLPDAQLATSTAELYEQVKPDIVSIVTWPGLHLKQVIEAVQAGVKMIVCEKPLALDNSEIDRMLEVCQRAGVRLAVAHQRRYDPRFELVRDLVREGAVGEKPILTGRVGDQWDILSWTTHWFDMANYIFDGPPTSILAGIDHRGERRYGHAVEHAAIVYAEYSNDRQALFVSGPESYIGFGISVEGTIGHLRMTETGAIIMTPTGTREIAAQTLPNLSGRDYVRLFADLAKAQASGEDFRCDARHTCWATRMAFATHESALHQRSISLPSITKYPPLEIIQHPPLPSAERSLRIAVLTDRHQWEEDVRRSGRDGLLEALSDLGHEATMVPLEERELAAADLTEKDLLVIYHTQRKSSEETRQLIGTWIRKGKPTLVSHCGIGAWDWDEYRQWIGRYWVWSDEDPARASGHPIEPCDIVIEAGTKLWSAPWVKGWLPTDEVYVRLGSAGPVEDIAWVDLHDERHPCAWRSKTAQNLAVFLPGHRADIWRLPVMRTALRSMIDLITT